MINKFNKSTLNKIIKWTSSKFNEYTKKEAIQQILNLKHEKNSKTIYLRCGSYGANSWTGYYYVVQKLPSNKIIIIDEYNRKELAWFDLRA